MTPRQIELVRTSWEHAAPVADTVARLFYRRLFELAPELRERFHTSMCEQGDNLVAAANDLTSGLESAEGVDGSGGKHAKAVTEAWVWSLSQEVGRHATDESRQAWTKVLSTQFAQTFKAVALGELEMAAV